MRIDLVAVLFTALCVYAESPVIAKVTAIEGDVTVFRKKDGLDLKAQILDGLFEGDSLKTAQGAAATLLYANGKIASVSGPVRMEIGRAAEDSVRGVSGDETVGAAGAGPALFAFVSEAEAGARKLMVRGPEDSFFIYKPGNTALVGGRPDMLWSACPDAQAYVVVYQKMGEVIMSVITVDTSLAYPSTVGDLEPGSYMLKVSAIKGPDTVGTVSRFVRVLKPEDAAEVKSAIDQVTAQKPDSFTLHLLTALIYEKKGLIPDAIGQYEVLLESEPDAAAVHLALYSLYTKLGMQSRGNVHLDRYRELTR